MESNICWSRLCRRKNFRNEGREISVVKKLYRKRKLSHDYKGDAVYDCGTEQRNEK